MMSKRCYEVVEPRVEHAILDAESRRNAASASDWEQPQRLGLTSRPLHRGLGKLSIDQRNKSEAGRLE